MNLIYTSLHQIDHSNNKINKIEITEQSEVLIEYVQKLLDEIINSNSKRKFKFRSDSTEARNAMTKMLNGEYDEASEIAAKRLLEKEKQAQEKIDRLNKKIQKGSMFQAYLEDDNYNKMIIICKADHNDFVDEIDFTLHKGLPWKKRIFKAILVKFDSNNEVLEVFIYDTNNVISKYWWSEFLELEEKYTDLHNTKKSLELLDRKIFNKIKKEYPADYMILRNTTVGYFRNNDEFDLDHYVNSTIENYHPINKDFPIIQVKEKIIELPDKWGFDKRFTIKKEEIKKRIINKIKLTNSIDLVLNDYISNLEDLIDTEIDNQGNKWLKIKTEEGYNYFKK